MTDKFTIRDMLVYTFLGFTVCLFYYFHNKSFITDLIIKSKDYSSLSLLLIIPLFYFIGHILMSIDDFIFNGVLLKFYPKKFKNKGFWKYYNLAFFGFRNIGLRRQFNITDEDFFKTTDKLLNENKEIYLKAEYYQVLSDLFKGVLLIIIISCLVDFYNYNIEYWKLILIILIWYRARSFSSYYIRMIRRSI